MFKNWDAQHFVIAIGAFITGLAAILLKMMTTPPSWLLYVTPVVALIFTVLGIRTTAPDDVAIVKAARGPKPPSGIAGAAGLLAFPFIFLLRLAVLAFTFAVIAVTFFGCISAQSVADIENLIDCVDQGLIQNLPAVQITAQCGPDATQAVIDARKAKLAQRQQATCTTVTLDAGVVSGPGR
jgi:hypothetical protein